MKIPKKYHVIKINSIEPPIITVEINNIVKIMIGYLNIISF